MVLYLICFDLGASAMEQNKQVEYWLGYLNSILCNTKAIPPTHATSKWRVILVGTRADLSPFDSAIDVSSYRTVYPVLPLYHMLFSISTKEGRNKYQLAELSETIHAECKRILDTHSSKVPCIYRDLLELLQSSPNHIINQNKIPNVHKRWTKESELEASLDYLHSVGEIVRFTEGRICIKPSMISQVLAKFIAPEDHVQEYATFKKTNVAGILQTSVNEIDQRYNNTLLSSFYL